MISQKDIKINGNNGAELTATIFVPENLRGAIMIGPATGIKRQFYFNFCKFLAENDFAVIAYNNEGIGDSSNNDLKKSGADLISWGQSDMSCVFAKLKELVPGTKYHLIGHSAGGQLVGLMHGATELTSIINYACSSGSLRHIKYPFKFSAMFFLNCFIPISNSLLGYTNSKLMGMGEPLPKRVAQQWKEWCNRTGYIKNHLETHEIINYYNQLSCPGLWINSTDDKIANNKNVDDMIRVFPNLKIEKLTLNPSEYNLNEIGHMKFFSKQNKVVWDIVMDWLMFNND